MHAATKTSSIIAAPSIKDVSKLIKLRDFVRQFPEKALAGGTQKRTY